MIFILKNGLGLSPPGSLCLPGAEPSMLLSLQGRMIQFITTVSLWPSFLKARQLRQSCLQNTICIAAASLPQKDWPRTLLPHIQPLESCPTAAKRRGGNPPRCPTPLPVGALPFHLLQISSPHSKTLGMPYLMEFRKGFLTKILKENKTVFSGIKCINKS